jgi:hypothetical protein
MNRPRFDAHSKILLTIIAACLVWLCFGRPYFVAPVDAQTSQPSQVRYNTVWAKNFVLVDDKGKARATLGCQVGGSPTLTLDDGKGQDRISLGLAEDGTPSLVLIDGNGQPRVVLGVAKWDDPRTGQRVKTAPSSLILSNKDGKIIWKAPPR